ncbi:MAG: hypothetical protein HY537_17820 [Deltaproteobacteria bacterium]|nr:hypothetical protein [Deltaproteobacteria bacterium]
MTFQRKCTVWLASLFLWPLTGTALVTDKTICDRLSSIEVVGKFLTKEFEFLCRQQGLEQLRQKGFYPISSTLDEGVSTFFLGGYQRLKARMSSAKNLSREFCEDFSQYREIAPKAFLRVDDIETSDVTDDGCDFHFYGNKIVIYTPEYIGRFDFISVDNLFITLEYLIEPISIIHDVHGLGVTAQNGNYLDLYSISLSKAETKGLHKKAYAEFLDSAKALREGVADHINDY